MFDFVKRKYSVIKYRVRKMIKWYKIIRKDKDYDYEFILIILREKLIDMYEFFNSKNTWSAGAKKNAKKIKLCISLINRILEDKGHNYIDLAKLNYYTEKNNKEDRKTKIKNENKIMNKASYLLEQDIDLLFKTINQYILDWWD